MAVEAPLLRATDVPQYLLARDLVSPRSVVESDLIVRDFSGRNRTFSAECKNATSYLLKQNRTAGLTTVAHEGDMYRALSSSPDMRPYLPQFFGYDADSGVLTVEFFHDGKDLASYYRDRRRPTVSTASAIGAALATVHSLPIDGADGIAGRRRPSVLSLHRPGLRLLNECSYASLELVRIIQSTNEFGDQLEDLRRNWTTTNLVHQDVRLKNFVWITSPTNPRAGRLKLIDWELSGVGDPGWDIGSALANYLNLWLMSIPVTASAPLEQSADLASCPLGDIQPAIHACWRSYVSRRGFDDDSAGAMLGSAVRFAAARLVQIAFESAQESASMTADAVLHLQVAYNILQRPSEAVAHLFGLPPPCVNGDRR